MTGFQSKVCLLYGYKKDPKVEGKILNAHNILCVFVRFILCTACLQRHVHSKIFLVIMPFQNHLYTTVLKLWPIPGPDFPSSPFWHLLQSRHLWYWAHTTLPINWAHALFLSWGLGIKTISARLFKFLFLYLLASKYHHSFLKHTD